MNRRRLFLVSRLLLLAALIGLPSMVGRIGPGEPAPLWLVLLLATVMFILFEVVLRLARPELYRR